MSQVDEPTREFFEITKDAPPHELLLEALDHCDAREAALDLGAGALRDSRALVARGFTAVTAVDRSPLTAETAAGIVGLNAVTATYDQFDFPVNHFSLVNAQFSLPFNPPDTFDDMFARLLASLKSNGIFSGQLFGDRDEWAANPKMTFHSRKQAEELLKPLEIIKFEEIEKDGTIANGTPKHWHLFNVIAKKP